MTKAHRAVAEPGAPPDFGLLFESVPGSYLVLDPQWFIVAVTDAYLHATSTVRDQILGRYVFDVFPDNPDDPASGSGRNMRASLEQVAAGRTTDVMALARHDLQSATAVGGFEERYWSPSNSPVFAHDGTLRYIVHRVENVTEFVKSSQATMQADTRLDDLALEPMAAELVQRRAEVAEASRQLKETNVELVATAGRELEEQRRLAAIVDSADLAIIGKSLDGIITSWNLGAQELYGYTPDEVIGQHISLLSPERRRTESSKILGRVAEGERIGQYFTERVRKDGELIDVVLVVSAVRDKSGAIIGASVMARDITERRRAAEAIHASEARKSAILASALDCVITMDHKGRVLEFNPAAERTFGYSNEEATGALMAELIIPPSLREAHATGLAHLLETGEGPILGQRLKLNAMRSDGSEFPVELSISQVDVAGPPLFTGYLRDITEQEHLEGQLRQSQRLESLGQLAGGVAHDFNNLLGVIINYSAFVDEAILNAVETPTTEYWDALRNDVGQIARAGERATELTRQLLAFARREVVQPRILNVNDVVRVLEPLLHRTLGEEVELTATLDATLWPVLADPGQIEQVLVNLAVNARDAMTAGGALRIDTDNVIADDDFVARHIGAQPGRYVRVRVSDSGTGMSPEVRLRAFEPFFTTKREGEGTGLGLATVYGIITQAGGYAEIYSEPGFGTTVSALLPATTKVSEVAEHHAAPVPSAGTETILVVEDEDAIREVTRRILTRNGYQVITAGSGVEALEITSQCEHIDLLITDVIMPNMLGKEVADCLTARRPDLRVLYMSGYARPILASRGTLEPGVFLIEKPFSEASFLDKVRAALDTDPTAITPECPGIRPGRQSGQPAGQPH